MPDIATTDQPRRVIFSVLEGGEFVELSRLASVMAERGYEIAFSFPISGYRNLAMDSRTCVDNGWVWVDARRRVHRSDDADPTGYEPLSLRRSDADRSLLLALVPILIVGVLLAPVYVLLRLLVTVGRLARRTALLGRADELIELVKNLVRIPRRRLQYRRMLSQLRPSVVVIGQDYAGSENSLLVRAGHEMGVPTVIAPFALATPRELAESLHDRRRHWVASSPLNRLLTRVRPRWRNRYKGRDLVRLPGYLALPLEVWRLSPPHPWVPNSGEADVIAAESPAMMSHYQRMGFPDTQVALTGSTVDDVLRDALMRRDALRCELAERLDVDPRRPIALVAWPPNQFGGREHPAAEFAEYGDLCRHWADVLAEIRDTYRTNVVVKLHPVLRVSDVPEVTKRDLPLSTLDTASLIAASDLFVASVSSTIRWAVAAGRPVVNYDVYQYGYLDFGPDDGVLNVDNLAAFRRTLRSLHDDRERFLAIASAAQARSEHWGRLDGDAGARVVGAIDALVARGPTHESRQRT